MSTESVFYIGLHEAVTVYRDKKEALRIYTLL